jgi:hypothetical protein
VDSSQFELADRWILSRLQHTTRAVTEHFHEFRLNEATSAVYHFLWDELADWYVEQVKPRLHGNASGGDAARATLVTAFETTLRLLHPIMPFITEELWSCLPGEREPVLAGAAWPEANEQLVDAESEERFALVQSLTGAIRGIRAEYGVKPGKTVRAAVEAASDLARGAFEAERSTVERLGKVEGLVFDSLEESVGAHAVLPDGSAVFVPRERELHEACARRGGRARTTEGANVARAAGYAGRQAALAGLLGAAAVGLVGACASMQAPPGAPYDPDPPILLTTTPDSGTVVGEFDDDVEFEFDEVIAERNLDRLITISPRHEEISVSWKRQRFTVKPRDGWHADAVYQVTLLPGVTDLQANRTEEGHTIVFSTGGDIPNTRITGSVVNWEGGQVALSALVEAIRLPDSLTYLGPTDSSGTFNLWFLPPDTYLLRAGIDGNGNRRIDAREPYDSVTVTFADSLLDRDFWTFRHDTVGPRVTGLTLEDSVTVAMEFSQSLALNLPPPAAFGVWELPDSNRVIVRQVLVRAEYDSLRQAAADSAAQVAADSAAAVRDSVAAALADSLGLAPDTVAAAPDTAVAPPEPPEVLTDSLAIAARADSVRAAALLSQRPALFTGLVIITVEPLEPGIRYWIDAEVGNLLGVLLQSGRFLTVPAVAEPDST